MVQLCGMWSYRVNEYNFLSSKSVQLGLNEE